MPNISWEEFSDLKHVLQTVRDKLVEPTKGTPIYINTTIEHIDEFILRHEEE